MALQKTFNLPNGISGDYVQIGYYHHDRRTREASFHFDLYASAAVAASSPYLATRERLAKLRLRGDKFDEWVSNEALATTGKTLLQRAYEAAKAEPLDGDFGPDAFADAVDV